MEFIKVEEFLKQSEKVQKVLMDWWKAEDLDPYYDTECNFNTVVVKLPDASFKFNKGNCIPLLTEGQLRKFIEEKTGRKVQLTVRPNNKYIIDLIGKRYHDKDINIWTDTDDLLGAYWQVAIKIAEKQGDNYGDTFRSL